MPADDLDNLMLRIQEINPMPATALTPVDISTLIAYHRRSRARKASGEKAPSKQTPKDITNILDAIGTAPKPTVKINFPFGKGKP